MYRSQRDFISYPEQIFQSELNTDKPLPVIPPILVYKYIQLIGKDNKGGYFLPLPPTVRYFSS